jgi:hypothetical protein
MPLMNTNRVAIVEYGLAMEIANQKIIIVTVFRVLDQRCMSRGCLASWILILFQCVDSQRPT